MVDRIVRALDRNVLEKYDLSTRTISVHYRLCYVRLWQDEQSIIPTSVPVVLPIVKEMREQFFTTRLDSRGISLDPTKSVSELDDFVCIFQPQQLSGTTEVSGLKATNVRCTCDDV